MNGVIVKGRFALLNKILLALLLHFLCLSHATPGDAQSYRTGLLPIGQEEREWLDLYGEKIAAIELSDDGRKRIDQYYNSIGLPPLSARTHSFEDAARVLPPAVDLSRTKYFPPIRDQGSIGSCASFATTYYQLTYEVARKNGWTVKQSGDNDKFSPKWTYNFANMGKDNGSNFTTNYQILMSKGGALWKDFAYWGDNSKQANYLEWCGDPGVWKNALSFRIRAFPEIETRNPERMLQQIKLLLINGKIITFGSYIFSYNYLPISDNPETPETDLATGVPCVSWVDGMEGHHALTIVGYDDSIWVDLNHDGRVTPGELGALRIANSWGTRWQNNGFTWIAYDALKNASIVSDTYNTCNRQPAIRYAFTMDLPEDSSPRILAEYTLRHTHRDQIRVDLGYSDSYANEPNHLLGWSFGCGAFTFAGRQSDRPEPMTFVTDYNDLMKIKGFYPQRFQTAKWYLKVTDGATGHPCTVDSFKLIDAASWPMRTMATDLRVAVDNDSFMASVSYTKGFDLINLSPLVEAGANEDLNISRATLNLSGTVADDGLPMWGKLTWSWRALTNSADVVIKDPNDLNTEVNFNAAGVYTLRLSASDGERRVYDDVTVVVHGEKDKRLIYMLDPENASDWRIDPYGTDSAAAGIWAIDTPEVSSDGHHWFQTDSVPNGVRCLITGAAGASAPAHANANDLDGGRTTASSPTIWLPDAHELTLSFHYYFTHDDRATDSDYLTVRIVGETGDQVLLREYGVNEYRTVLFWCFERYDITQFKGQSVRIEIEAADNDGDSLIEAALDNVAIWQVPASPYDTVAHLNVAQHSSCEDGSGVNTRIEWDAVPGATAYEIWYKKAYVDSWSDTDYYLTTPLTSCLLRRLPDNGDIHVRIKAHHGHGVSNFSETFEITPPSTF